MSAMVRATSSRVMRDHSIRDAERGQSSRPSRMKPYGQMPSRIVSISTSQLKLGKAMRARTRAEAAPIQIY